MASFSNSDSSDYSDENGETLGYLFGQQHNLINAKGLQTSKPAQKMKWDDSKTSLTKDRLAGFITESPFSFKNPIFFSVAPKNTYPRKKFDVKQSKRQLFNNCAKSVANRHGAVIEAISPVKDKEV